MRAGGPGGSRARRPEHVISPEEVGEWLADSAVKSVTYHRTTRQAADDIIEHGVDLSKSWRGAYGAGFYTATSTEGLPGDIDVPVAVRLRNPLQGHAGEIGARLDVLTRQLGYGAMTPRAAAAVRRHLVESGYDGVVVEDAGGDGIDYVIAIESGSVKVVVD